VIAKIEVRRELNSRRHRFLHHEFQHHVHDKRNQHEEQIFEDEFNQNRGAVRYFTRSFKEIEHPSHNDNSVVMKYNYDDDTYTIVKSLQGHELPSYPH
jgi:hypothetical protein